MGRSWKLDDQGVGESPKRYYLRQINFQICFCRKIRQNKTFPTKIITFVDMGRSRKLDDQVSVKAPNANIYVKKLFRYVFVGNFDRITHFRPK